MLNTLAQNCFVELEGFEPSSKQGTKRLSTCLSFLYFRVVAGEKRPTKTLSPKFSHENRGASRTSPFFLKPQIGVPVGEALRETTRRTNLVGAIKPEVLGTFYAASA